MPHPVSIRSAHARVAALNRWRPDDEVALIEARGVLAVALATKLTAAAVAALRGGER